MSDCFSFILPFVLSDKFWLVTNLQKKALQNSNARVTAKNPIEAIDCIYYHKRRPSGIIPQDPSLSSFFQEVIARPGCFRVGCFAQMPLVRGRLLSKLESEASLAQLVMEKTRNTWPNKKWWYQRWNGNYCYVSFIFKTMHITCGPKLAVWWSVGVGRRWTFWIEDPKRHHSP